MELETIYYFEDKEILTNATYVGYVEIKYELILRSLIIIQIINRDVIGTVVKDMSDSKDKGFTFKVKYSWS